MLTIVTALPWEASRFGARLRGRRRVEAGEGWAVWGTHRGVEVRVLVSGPGEARARAAAEALASMTPAATGILSTGVAAGLVDRLKPGSMVLGTRVQHLRLAGGRIGAPIVAEAEFLEFVGRALTASGVEHERGDVLTVDEALLKPEQKRRQQEQTRALAAGMEDYVWAQQADVMGVPFVAARAVLDPVGASVPAAVLGWDWRGARGSEVAVSLPPCNL